MKQNSKLLFHKITSPGSLRTFPWLFFWGGGVWRPPKSTRITYMAPPSASIHSALWKHLKPFPLSLPSRASVHAHIMSAFWMPLWLTRLLNYLDSWKLFLKNFFPPYCFPEFSQLPVYALFLPHAQLFLKNSLRVSCLFSEFTHLNLYKIQAINHDQNQGSTFFTFSLVYLFHV